MRAFPLRPAPDGPCTLDGPGARFPLRWAGAHRERFFASVLLVEKVFA
jgi:hypothetical protein